MYLLDSNVFISAHRFHYSFDFHPGFWDWLIHANAEDRVHSIKRVYEEICRQEDQLSTWAKANKRFFLDTPSEFDDQLKRVTNSVNDGNYKPSEIETFFSSADYYLIDHALSKDFKVVTHEVSRSRKGKIKILPVCQKLEITCITPFEMLRQEGTQFVMISTDE